MAFLGPFQVSRDADGSVAQAGPWTEPSEGGRRGDDVHLDGPVVDDVLMDEVSWR